MESFIIFDESIISFLLYDQVYKCIRCFLGNGFTICITLTKISLKVLAVPNDIINLYCQ